MVSGTLGHNHSLVSKQYDKIVVKGVFFGLLIIGTVMAVTKF